MHTRFVPSPSALSLLSAAAGPAVADEPPPLPDDPAELAADIDTDIAAAEAATYMDPGSNFVCWGWNYYGQATPAAGNDYVAIAAGAWHGLALKTDGSIVGWGYDDRGQATPPAGSDYVAIAAGDHHGLALAVDP